MPKLLLPGSQAPWFKCRTRANPDFVFNTIAGRYIVLFFFGSSEAPVSAKLLDAILAQRSRFNDSDLSFFGVSTDPQDEGRERLADAVPGIRYFWDTTRSISQLYRTLHPDGTQEPVIYLIDPALRIVGSLRPAQNPEASIDSLFELLDRLPKARSPYVAPLQAPVLVLPRVFEPELCEALINYYTTHGGSESGFMRESNGKTILVTDPRHKRRRDCTLEDERLQKACVARIRERLVPEIEKSFQFAATRIERQIIACYDAMDHAHFRPHRDNTTSGTAHRRFAVSLFLGSEEYEGGFVRFPEFGPALYRAPQGGAVVFSCSLLHEATPVTKGKRYMYLPFLYDEAAAKIRRANLPSLEKREEQHAWIEHSSQGVPS